MKKHGPDICYSGWTRKIHARTSKNEYQIWWVSNIYKSCCVIRAWQLSQHIRTYLVSSVLGFLSKTSRTTKKIHQNQLAVQRVVLIHKCMPSILGTSSTMLTRDSAWRVLHKIPIYVIFWPGSPAHASLYFLGQVFDLVSISWVLLRNFLHFSLTHL